MDNLLWSYPKGVFRCNEINLACRSTLIRDFLIPFWRATAGSQKDLLFFAAVGHRGQFHNSVQRYLSSYIWHQDVVNCLPRQCLSLFILSRHWLSRSPYLDNNVLLQKEFWRRSIEFNFSDDVFTVRLPNIFGVSSTRPWLITFLSKIKTDIRLEISLPCTKAEASQKLRMLSRSIADCQSLTLNVMIQVSQFVSNSH